MIMVSILESRDGNDSAHHKLHVSKTPPKLGRIITDNAYTCDPGERLPHWIRCPFARGIDTLTRGSSFCNNQAFEENPEVLFLGCKVQITNEDRQSWVTLGAFECPIPTSSCLCLANQ